MYTRYFASMLCLTVFVSTVNSQIFQKSFKPVSGVNNYASEIFKHGSTGYVITGSGVSRIDANGDPISTIPMPCDEDGGSMATTSDGGYIVASCSDGIFKYSSNGALEWSKDSISYNSIRQTSDGNYIVTVKSSTIKMAMIGPTGSRLWVSGGYGAPGISSRGELCVEAKDGGYYLCGTYVSSGLDENYFVARFRNDKSVAWFKNYGHFSNTDNAYDICPTSDGGCIVIGTGSYGAAGALHMNVYRLDTSGNVVWTKNYGGTNSDYGYCARQTSDGGFIFVGATKNFGASGKNVYAVRTDASGNVTWQRNWGGAADDIGLGVCETTDGGFIICGSKSHNISTKTGEVYLIKTDANGVTTSITDVENSATRLKVYPNPVKDIMYLDLNGNSTIQIMDINGREVGSFVSNELHYHMDLRMLSPGMYSMMVITNEDRVVKRVIKE